EGGGGAGTRHREGGGGAEQCSATGKAECCHGPSSVFRPKRKARASTASRIVRPNDCWLPIIWASVLRELPLPARPLVPAVASFGVPRRPLRAGCCPVSSGKINGRNDMRTNPTAFAIALITTAVATGVATAQSSYPCTETNANLPNPYRQ